MKKLTPNKILLTYILSIFIFASFYSYFPFEFYHSTVSYESTYKNDYEKVKQEFGQVIYRNFYNTYKVDTLVADSQTFDVSKIRIEDINLRNDITFSCSIWCKRRTFLTGPNGKKSLFYFPSTVFFNISLSDWRKLKSILTDEDVPAYFGVFSADSSCEKQNIPIDKIITVGYPDDNSSTGRWPVYGAPIILPSSLVKSLYGYVQSVKGLPSYTSGNFNRMFYLSAVTITTLGYGDIVPISDRTRILISFEAIWGIILIGLYLNALANKIINRQNK